MVAPGAKSDVYACLFNYFGLILENILNCSVLILFDSLKIQHFYYEIHWDSVFCHNGDAETWLQICVY